MNNLSKIKHTLKEKQTFLSQNFRVEKIAIFGSYARGEETENSDLDILIEYQKAPTLLMLIELKDYLTHLLGIPVDVVTKNGLKKRIKEKILAEMILL
jgi:uncharacterized protein